MRNFRVRFQIDIFAIEHHPFSIRRRHRRADAFELHHVFEGEWMFATGDTGPWCLREKRSCERETECDKNFHLAVKLPPNLRTCNESARVAHASRVLVSASRRNSLFSGKSAIATTPSPTRETRALPGVQRATGRESIVRSIYARNASRAIS